MFGTHERYARMKDGTVAYLRDMRPSDDVHVVAGFSRLSEASRYARFFTPLQELSPEQLRYFTQVDGSHHVAVVAFSADGGLPLGTGRFVRDVADPASAEIALTICDDAQGRGLGLALLALLADEARELGVTSFTADVQSTNTRMRGLIRKIGAEREGSDGSVVHYRWRP